MSDNIKIPKINKVIISGRISNDFELKTTAKGTPVVRITLAVDKATKKADGTYDNQASFLDVIAWSKWAESLPEKAHKGSPIIVEGHIEARNYVDSNNVNRKSVEIIAEYIQFLEYKAKDETELTEQTEPQTNDDVPF